MSPMTVTEASDRPLILVASQEPDFTQCLRVFLDNSGYRVEATNAAAPALAVAADLQPDLVILALSREGIVKALQGLRNEAATRETPVVVLSAASPEHPEFAPVCGLWQAYIQMPLELDDVMEHVARLLGCD
jgi:two-component system OmpR family response regulator